VKIPQEVPKISVIPITHQVVNDENQPFGIMPRQAEEKRNKKSLKSTFDTVKLNAPLQASNKQPKVEIKTNAENRTELRRQETSAQRVKLNPTEAI
jgi:hypothetical protein